MDDILYIVFLIIWIIYAFYKNNQKQKKSARQSGEAQEAPSEDQPKPRSFLEEILLGEETPPEPVPEPVSRYETIEDEVAKDEAGSKTDEEELYETITFEIPADYKFAGEQFTYEKEMYSEVGDSMNMSEDDKEHKKDDSHEIYDTDNVSYTDEISDFNLRKAVIYSEILKCPYC